MINVAVDADVFIFGRSAKRTHLFSSLPPLAGSNQNTALSGGMHPTVHYKSLARQREDAE